MKRQEIIEILIEHEGNKNIDLKRFIFEGDKFVAHYKTNNEVVFLLFVLKNKQIISKKEKRTKYLGVNPLNSRSQIDGWEKVIDLNKTNKNKEIVNDFWQKILFVGGYKTKDIMSNYISTKKYFQHNVDNGIADGLGQLFYSIDKMNGYGSDLKYDKQIDIVAQGNFVFIISEQNWKNPKTKVKEVWSYFDLFRVEENKIVEHWDILGRDK